MLKIFCENNCISPFLAPYFTAKNYAFTSFEDCDLVLSSSFAWGDTDSQKYQDRLNTYADLGSKKVVAFWVTDFEGPLTIPPNVHLYRTSLHKSTKRATEDVLAFVFEPLTVPFTPFSRTPKPVVSFCGLVSAHRKPLLDLLRSRHNIDVTTSFIERTQFWAGKPHDPTIVKEFEINVINSHFVVANRGNGNFSMRFYQTLSAGRIPVLIDTDMVLPFEDEIDWTKYCVRAKTNEELLQALVALYNDPDKDIAAMQEDCYNLYKNVFEPNEYFCKLTAHVTQTQKV
jgi:hypothetical protein